MHEGVCVVLKNNDISFNEVGLIFDGYGIIQDNKMWGNLHRSTIDLGKEALARAKVEAVTLLSCMRVICAAVHYDGKRCQQIPPRRL